MIRILLSFLVLTFSFNVSAYEIQADLTNLTNQIEIEEGDVFKARLRVWPIKGEEPETLFAYFKNATLMDFFRITKVYSSEFSKTNPEVLEVVFNLVLIKVFNKDIVHIWNFKDLNIPIEFKKITPLKSPDSQAFILAKQKQINYKKEESYLVLIVIMSLIALFFLIKMALKMREKQHLKKQRREVINKWNNTFNTSRNREDFEKIYTTRSEWIGVLGQKTPAIIDFFNVLNLHQYKEEWDEDVEIEINESFDEIRELFKELR